MKTLLQTLKQFKSADFGRYAARWIFANVWGIPTMYLLVSVFGLNTFWSMMVFSVLGAFTWYFPDKWLLNAASRPRWLNNLTKVLTTPIPKVMRFVKQLKGA